MKSAVRMLLLSAAAFTMIGATLNPTVTVLRQAQTPVPPECLSSDAPAGGPRIDVAELDAAVPVAADLTPPRSADLRAAFRDVQSALQRDDREGFRAALANARELAAAHPAGGEKDAAAAALAAYDDVARVWEHQFESPTGAFFAEGSDVHRAVASYPNYESTVRRQVIETGGVRYFPSRETREFVGRVAAERAARLGVRPQSQPKFTARTPRATSPEPSPSAALPPVRPRRTRVTKAAAVVAPVVRPSAARQPAARPVVRATPPPAPAPVTPPEPDPAPPVVPSTTTVEPIPIATAATADPIAVPETTTTAAATTTEATPAAEPKRPGRGLLLPAIVILITIGVLFLLFRASD